MPPRVISASTKNTPPPTAPPAQHRRCCRPASASAASERGERARVRDHIGHSKSQHVGRRNQTSSAATSSDTTSACSEVESRGRDSHRGPAGSRSDSPTHARGQAPCCQGKRPASVLVHEVLFERRQLTTRRLARSTSGRPSEEEERVLPSLTLSARSADGSERGDRSRLQEVQASRSPAPTRRPAASRSAPRPRRERGDVADLLVRQRGLLALRRLYRRIDGAVAIGMRSRCSFG